MKTYIIYVGGNLQIKNLNRCIIMKIDKKTLEFELDLAFDLKMSEKYGKDCFDSLTLGVCEDWEHCGDCY